VEVTSSNLVVPTKCHNVKVLGLGVFFSL